MFRESQQREGFVPLYNIRTDLALEAKEIVQTHTAAEIPGVLSENLQEDGIAISRMQVQTEQAAQQLGKRDRKSVV